MKLKADLKKNASFFVFILMLLAVRWSFADQYRVPTGSMEPTIHIGDHVFINKMAYSMKLPFTDIHLLETGEPHRGDIIVFTSTEDESMNLIKRLIAIPGDHVQIRNGIVSINGTAIAGSEKILASLATDPEPELLYEERLEDSHYTVKRLPYFARREEFDFVVPADRYFFMGDNRDNSHDGRYFGLVPKDHLKGRALAVIWNIRLQDWLPTMELDRIGLGI
jgi:signal peptidase I